MFINVSTTLSRRDVGFCALQADDMVVGCAACYMWRSHLCQVTQNHAPCAVARGKNKKRCSVSLEWVEVAVGCTASDRVLSVMHRL